MGLLCLRVRCCVLRLANRGALWALLISPLVVGLTPLSSFSVFSLFFIFSVFYFSVVCALSPLPSIFAWREDGRGQGPRSQITLFLTSSSWRCISKFTGSTNKFVNVDKCTLM